MYELLVDTRHQRIKWLLTEMNLKFQICVQQLENPNLTTVLEIRDFQWGGQWAEGLKGILSPQVVQERCIFLLPRSTENGEN